MQPLVSVSLVDGMGGSMETFMQGGQTFVMGSRGQRYGVRIRNNTRERLEIVLTVDGRDAVNGMRADSQRDRGYVVGPMSSVTIEGFRTSLDTVATFRFSDPAASFAGRMGQMQNLGMIQVAAFKERQQAVAMRPHRKMAPGSAAPSTRDGRSSAAPSPKRRVMGPRADSNLGTEFGEERDSSVREVSFVRASNMAAQRLTVRYDDAQGLMARGIELRRDSDLMRRPLPVAPVSRRPDRRRFAQPPR
jgi:hypothetical protein